MNDESSLERGPVYCYWSGFVHSAFGLPGLKDAATDSDSVAAAISAFKAAPGKSICGKTAASYS